uniref:interleukin-17C n=1 Tax=Euleptes europaea TaxID=460621 RepID=UPI002542476C|nr:interleukin-17C [Euleptes europaea]
MPTATRSIPIKVDLLRSLLLFALLLLAWTEAKRHHRQHCFNPDEVPEGHVPTEFLSRARRWDRHSAVQLVPYLEKELAEGRRHRRHSGSNCPALRVQDLRHSSIHQRSISPWSHRIDEDENRYPQKLSFAYCLCKGCINASTGLETTALNSVPVYQEMMVLRRKPCPRSHVEATPAPTHPAAFTLVVDYVKVPVACACVLPQSNR